MGVVYYVLYKRLVSTAVRLSGRSRYHVLAGGIEVITYYVTGYKVAHRTADSAYAEALKTHYSLLGITVEVIRYARD